MAVPDWVWDVDEFDEVVCVVCGWRKPGHGQHCNLVDLLVRYNADGARLAAYDAFHDDAWALVGQWIAGTEGPERLTRLEAADKLIGLFDRHPDAGPWRCVDESCGNEDRHELGDGECWGSK